MAPIQLTLNHNGESYLVEIDDYDFTVVGLYIRDNGDAYPVDLNEIDDELDYQLCLLCERLNPHDND